MPLQVRGRAPYPEQGEQGSPGAPGDQGPAGPPGPPGASGGFYRHEQVHPSVTWLVQHNLGFYPGGVRVWAAEGHEVEPRVVHLSMTVTQLIFLDPTAGVADVS